MSFYYIRITWLPIQFRHNREGRIRHPILTYAGEHRGLLKRRWQTVFYPQILLKTQNYFMSFGM